MSKTTLPSTLNTKIYDLETKTVTASGNSGIVYVPKAWIGKRVKVLLIEPVNE